MKDWQVKFYLVDMYHSYIIQAKNEFEAYMTVLNRFSNRAQELLRDLSITRHYQEWN